MRVKLVIPEHAAGFIDPQTKRSPFIDPETKQVIAIVDVPENTFWVRRVLSGELERVEESAAPATTPTGNEPIKPLTTRGGK
jgi:hypothetical protein